MDGADPETSGTLQAKKRALLGQKDRLRLLKKMQSGKERVQRKMDRGRSSKGDGMLSGDVGSKPDIKPAVREARYIRHRRSCPRILHHLSRLCLFCQAILVEHSLARQPMLNPSPVRALFSSQSN